MIPVRDSRDAPMILTRSFQRCAIYGIIMLYIKGSLIQGIMAGGLDRGSGVQTSGPCPLKHSHILRRRAGWMIPENISNAIGLDGTLKFNTMNEIIISVRGRLGWRPEVAAEYSPSLMKAVEYLKEICKRFQS
jgi:hypothetical protein